MPTKMLRELAASYKTEADLRDRARAYADPPPPPGVCVRRSDAATPAGAEFIREAKLLRIPVILTIPSAA